MKKVLPLIFSILLIILLLIFLHASNTASGATINTSIEVEDQGDINQIGPEWYNPAWHYRIPVIIDNSHMNLTYYQVLVELNADNFNFNLANNDGSDVRITDSDGITELNYWLEYWDATERLAYIWVRVPRPAVGNTIIYLYYNKIPQEQIDIFRKRNPNIIVNIKKMI